MSERQIIIGLITSTEYCLSIRDYWDIRFIESQTARILARWIWEYFKQYEKAPQRDIEGIIQTKSKETKLSKAILREIQEEILPGLSEEYENTPENLLYLTQETLKYFSERHLSLFSESVLELKKQGKFEEAHKLIKEFKPLEVFTKKIDDFILTVNQIKEKGREYPLTLLHPWLKEGQLTIIYGTYGSGKSLLALSTAYILGLHDFAEEDCDIGQWKVRHNTGCLYMDGELGELEMEERIRGFEWLGKQPPGYKLRVFSIPEYQLETEDTFYLSNRVNQMKILHWLEEHPTYRLIILDSASTLFGLQDENDNSEWNNKINPFLRDLRALKVAPILLHHSGKDNKKGLRGASAMGAMAHNIFRIVSHDRKSVENGEAWFKVSADKQRAAGKSFKPFSLHYYQEQGETETHWEVTENY